MAENSENNRLRGCVEHFIFRNEENGYTVMVVMEEGREVTACGFCRDIDPGDEISAEGRYILHPSYGRQFEIASYAVVPPADSVSMERYLGSGAIKGVGAALAARIVKKFGEDTFRIIEDEPERLAEIRGISPKKAMDIAIQLEEKRDLRDAMVYLGKFRISQALSVKIFEKYRTDLYRVIEENPYRLAEDIRGVGFQTADRIAHQLGIAENSEHRIRSGILFALGQSQGEGHSYLPTQEVVRRGAELLGLSEEETGRELDALILDGKVIARGERVYTPALYHAELGCARLLRERNLRLCELGPEEEERVERKVRETSERLGMEIDSLQIRAVKECVQSGIYLLSGGPGTGKTTTINLIIRYFQEEGLDLALAAPTGRAAKRMTEATGYEARTIHRLLEVGGGADSDALATFQRNADNPLEADVVIIDEMSMVDLLLFRALLSAIVPGTRLILVGDMDQLPSVGPGQVLRDLIECGVYPGLRLARIFRQALGSDIVVNAHKINEGEQIRLDTNSRDFLFLERDNTEKIKEIMVWMLRDKLPAYCNAGVLEIQVLTPMRKGALGCVELNRYLQSALNPPSPAKPEHLYGDTLFRTGDKVMQIRNNYKLEWKIYGKYGIEVDSGLGVFNGDMGIVTEIRERESFLKVEFDDRRVVEVPFGGLDELELAYATTIHKSQGSEYPAVILPLLDPPALMQYRNLLYTGVTRAKSCVVLLGSSRTVRTMIENRSGRERYGSLQEQILELEGL